MVIAGSIIAALLLGLLCVYGLGKLMHSRWVSPSRESLAQFEHHGKVRGESFEVLFSPFDPAAFLHDPARENYKLTLTGDGFDLRPSFPTSLYSRAHPLFFPWDSVRSMERLFITNLRVKVFSRDEGFFLYAGIKPAHRMMDEWEARRSQS